MRNTRRLLSRPRSRWILLAVGLAVMLAVVLTIVVLATTRDAPRIVASPSPTQPTASGITAVTTSADGNDPMRSLEVDATVPSDDDELAISVDPGAAHQRVEGFGAAMTHSSAAVLAGMPADARTALLEELFAADGPARLSTLRLPIGASDFVDTDAFTFDDLPAGETDWELDRFSIDPDRQVLIPVLQEVRAINPDLRLIASPWSPPAWMKTNGRLEGGRLRDEDRAYEAYAAYLVRFLSEYRDAGLEIDYLTVQNEPQLRYPDGYPGTDMPFWQQAKLIDVLGPALKDARLDAAILGFDHNWELSPGDVATTPEGEDPAYHYPADLLNTPAAQWIAGIAFHCYSGNAAAQSRLWEQFREIEIWVTECSGSSAPGESRSIVFADTFSWQATNLLLDSLRNRAAGVLTWNLALDENGGPHRGGCSTCSGVVTVRPAGTAIRNAEYYVLASAARFVPPGSVRVDSTSADAELRHVGFRTPSDRTVLIVWNPSGVARSIDAGDGRRTVTVELPPSSLSTISWDAPGR